MNLTGKVALVTGASRGIGQAAAIELAKAGADIIVNFIGNEVVAQETVEAIEALGRKAIKIKAHVGDADDVQAMVDEAHATFGHIDILVNNAGITRDGLFMWMTYEDWSKVIQTTLDGFYNVTNFFIQKMLRNRYGRIINIASVSGVKGTAGQTNYSAGKGALVAATKALAQEVAKRNITVNAIAPGFIRTDMTSELDENELVKLIPVGRFGEAEEVADLVSFLVSKKASYITGEVININGGIYS